MFLLPALLLLQAQAPAPAPPPAKPDPVPPARIELTTPFPVHLGSVGPREVREAAYGIKSTHDRPFRFRVLDLSLGLSLDEGQLAAPLQPGEVRMLKVRVDPAGMEGFVRGAVRLGTDDPAQPNYILRYDMTVRPEVAVDAERKSLGEVAPHESPKQIFDTIGYSVQWATVFPRRNFLISLFGLLSCHCFRNGNHSLQGVAEFLQAIQINFSELCRGELSGANQVTQFCHGHECNFFIRIRQAYLIRKSPI